MDADRVVDEVLAELADVDLAVNEEAKGAPSHYLQEHRHESIRTVRDILATRPPSPAPGRVRCAWR